MTKSRARDCLTVLAVLSFAGVFAGTGFGGRPGSGAGERESRTLAKAQARVRSYGPDPLSPSVTLGKDANGRVVIVRGPRATVGYFYDDEGRIVTAVDDRGGRRDTVYAGAGQQIIREERVAAAGGAPMRKVYRYDGAGVPTLVAWIPAGTDPNVLVKRTGLPPGVLQESSTPPVERSGKSQDSEWVAVTGGLASFHAIISREVPGTQTATTCFNGTEMTVVTKHTDVGWVDTDSDGGYRLSKYTAGGEPYWVEDSHGTVLVARYDDVGRVTSARFGSRVGLDYSYVGDSRYWSSKRVKDLKDGRELLKLQNLAQEAGRALPSPGPILPPSYAGIAIMLPGAGQVAGWFQEYDRAFLVAWLGSAPYALKPLNRGGESIYTISFSYPLGRERIDWTAGAMVVYISTGEGQVGPGDFRQVLVRFARPVGKARQASSDALMLGPCSEGLRPDECI